MTETETPIDAPVEVQPKIKKSNYASTKKWRQKNRDKATELCKKYRENHREHMAEYHRQYRARKRVAQQAEIEVA